MRSFKIESSNKTRYLRTKKLGTSGQVVRGFPGVYPGSPGTLGDPGAERRAEITSSELLPGLEIPPRADIDTHRQRGVEFGTGGWSSALSLAP